MQTNKPLYKNKFNPEHTLTSWVKTKYYLRRIFVNCCLLFLLPIPGHLVAQSTKEGFKKIPIEVNNIIFDGRITGIAQDHNGFLWIATSRHGLIRYDGYQFEMYNNILGESITIQDNIITESLYVDYTGDLWIGTSYGLSRYKSECDCFFPYIADPNNLISTGIITTITEDSANNLWIGVQDGGLFRYERESDTFTRFLADPTDPDALANDIVRILLADRQNRIWIGTGYGLMGSAGGLVRFDPSTGKSKRYRHEPNNPNSLIDNRISALLEDQEGLIWVGTFQNGLHYYHPEKDNFERMVYDPANPNRLHAPPGKKVWDTSPFVKILHQDQAGGFWVGTCGGGINHFASNTNEVSHYVHDPANPNGITNDKLWSFCEDRSGQLWLGNLTQGGLHKLNPSLKKITRYSESNNLIVTRICQSKEKPEQILLGTYFKGLQKMDINTGEIKPFYHKGMRESDINTEHVQEIYEDINGIIWLGIGSGFFELDHWKGELGDGGLGRLNLQTGTFNFYVIPRIDSIATFNNTVYRICEDKEGFLWLATGKGGLFRFDKDKEVFKHYSLPGKNKQTRGAEIYLIEKDSSGTIWVGDAAGEGALFCYDPDNDNFTPFLEGYKPLCLYEDSYNRIWLGTTNQGVLHFSADKSHFEQKKAIDGLPSNLVSGILEGPRGVYWISTDKGISKYEAESKKFAQTGLPRQEFNNSLVKMNNGQLFFGGKSVLVSFYPEQVSGNLTPPELSLRYLSISGESYDLNKLKSGILQRIILSHQQNDLSAEYVALHYSNPAKNQYRYMLEPYDQDWIEAGTQRMVRYTNLDPGAYTLRVTGANDNDVWNEKGISVPFLIKPAWWTRWWAYLLYFIIFGVMVYGFYNFQLSKTLAIQKSKRLQEINQLKTTLYNNITHEFRTPLTVILGMTKNLQSETEQQQLENFAQPLKMIERNGQNLLQLVNEMLDLAKIDSGNLELKLQQADVIPFIKYLVESFHSLAAEKHINLHFHATEQTLLMDFDADKLAVIISNLLSNAIKFTPVGGEVVFQVKSERVKGEGNAGPSTLFTSHPSFGRQRLAVGEALLTLQVKDNGIGISAEELPHIFDRFYQADHSSVRRYQGTGIGLALTKELVELMGGTIQVESEPEKGSEFIVQLPIHTKALLTENAANINLPTQIISSEGNYFYEDATSGTVDLPLVLIIEDHTDVANYIGTCLQGKYQYLYAANGKLGIEMAFEKIPDLIISDVMMPEKDGFEVCATLKADERTNHIPIILLTAKVAVQDRLEGLAQGADAYLAKPFEKEELWIRLHQLFELRQTLQKKYSEQLLTDAPDETKVVQEDPFLAKARTIILAELENENFSLNELSQMLYLSRSQVHRKIKAVTGMSSAIFIRSIRLQEAKKMLASTHLTISEIAYQVGFKSPVYFSQMFKETFGESPSDIRKG